MVTLADIGHDGDSTFIETQAFAQQFPQMASAFGPWGVAIGTAAAMAMTRLLNGRWGLF
jgi:hypothetical protein